MRTLFVIFFTIALIAPVFAQFDSGQISGFVRDESGAVVPGAVVVARNEGTGEERRTTTNADGYYVFPQLFVGRYSIVADAAGFKKFLNTGIVLNAEAKVSVSVGLTIGAVTDQVEVQASAVQVKTDSADVGTVDRYQADPEPHTERPQPGLSGRTDAGRGRRPGDRHLRSGQRQQRQFQHQWRPAR